MKHKVKKIWLCKWLDITGSADWCSQDKAAKEEPAICFTIGFIVFQDKNKTIFSNEFSFMDPHEIGNRTVIPNSVILKKTLLHTLKEGGNNGL